MEELTHVRSRSRMAAALEPGGSVRMFGPFIIFPRLNVPSLAEARRNSNPAKRQSSGARRAAEPHPNRTADHPVRSASLTQGGGTCISRAGQANRASYPPFSTL